MIPLTPTDLDDGLTPRPPKPTRPPNLRLTEGHESDPNWKPGRGLKTSTVLLILVATVLFYAIIFAFISLQETRKSEARAKIAEAAAEQAESRAHYAGLKVMEQEVRVKYLEEMLFRRTGWVANPNAPIK